MFKTICNSCFYSQVKRFKDKQTSICTHEQGAKTHRQYCPDYMNRDGVAGWQQKEWGMSGKYKEPWDSPTCTEKFHDNRTIK